MNITGVERIIVGVDDFAETKRFLSAYGLTQKDAGQTGATFDALDGSGVDVRLLADPSLPAANANGPTVRCAVWGVSTQADLEAIAEELSKDRQITWKDGVLSSTDDDNNAIAFRVSQRSEYESHHPLLNVAGHKPARFNQRVSFVDRGPPRQLGHIVYWSPDPQRAMKFYVDRLQFRVTDTFLNMGVFGRAKGHSDHHSIFFIKNPGVPAGFQHVEFTFADVQDVIMGGHSLTKQGFDTAFGPGRFECGSNWYWYFKTPMGGAFELGADMDQVDDNWVPGVFENQRDAGGWAMGFNFDRSRL